MECASGWGKVKEKMECASGWGNVFFFRKCASDWGNSKKVKNVKNGGNYVCAYKASIHKHGSPKF